MSSSSLNSSKIVYSKNQLRALSHTRTANSKPVLPPSIDRSTVKHIQTDKKKQRSNQKKGSWKNQKKDSKPSHDSHIGGDDPPEWADSHLDHADNFDFSAQTLDRDHREKVEVKEAIPGPPGKLKDIIPTSSTSVGVSRFGFALRDNEVLPPMPVNARVYRSQDFSSPPRSSKSEEQIAKSKFGFALEATPDVNLDMTKKTATPAATGSRFGFIKPDLEEDVKMKPMSVSGFFESFKDVDLPPMPTPAVMGNRGGPKPLYMEFENQPVNSNAPSNLSSSEPDSEVRSVPNYVRNYVHLGSDIQAPNRPATVDLRTLFSSDSFTRAQPVPSRPFPSGDVEYAAKVNK